MWRGQSEEPMIQRSRFRGFNGLLCGAGGEAPCTVSAMEMIIPGTNDTYCTAYSITSVALELPDGDYKLLANGKPSW